MEVFGSDCAVCLTWMWMIGMGGVRMTMTDQRHPKKRCTGK